MALSFDLHHKDSVVVVPSGSVSGTFAVALWFNPSTLIGYDGWSSVDLMGTRAPSDWGFSISHYGGNTIYLLIGDGQQGLDTPSVNVNYQTNNWYHLLCVVTSTGYIFYWNGEQIATGTYASSTPLLYDSNHHIHFAATGQTSSNSFYSGLLDDIRIYNRVLSASEIRTIYRAKGADNILIGLKGRWMFNERRDGETATDANTIKDTSGNNNHGTPCGSPVYRTTIIRKRPVMVA